MHLVYIGFGIVKKIFEQKIHGEGGEILNFAGGGSSNVLLENTTNLPMSCTNLQDKYWVPRP